MTQRFVGGSSSSSSSWPANGGRGRGGGCSRGGGHGGGCGKEEFLAGCLKSFKRRGYTVEVQKRMRGKEAYVDELIIANVCRWTGGAFLSRLQSLTILLFVS